MNYFNFIFFNRIIADQQSKMVRYVGGESRDFPSGVWRIANIWHHDRAQCIFLRSDLTVHLLKKLDG